MDKAQSFAMQYGYYDKGKKKACCVGYNAGYKQAEKDLALTVEDVLLLMHIWTELPDLQFKTLEAIAEETLKRFNEQRKK